MSFDVYVERPLPTDRTLARCVACTNELDLDASEDDGRTRCFDCDGRVRRWEERDTWAGNYTANMGAFFAWALQGVDTDEPAKRSDSRDAIFGKRPVDGLYMLHGMCAEAAALKLRKALERIDAAPAGSLDRFNAPNGWGHWDSATDFLRSILRHCEREPSWLVRVSM